VRHLRVFPVVAKSAAGTVATEPVVTCCCVADDLSQVALGLSDGTVQLLRTADVLRDRFLSFKPLVSIEARLPLTPAAVTNVAFCYAPGGGGPPTDLWIVTSDALLSVSSAGLRSEQCCVLTDSGGAAPECACVSDLRGQLVVGRPEAIYLYGADERGPCFAFDGAKRCLLFHRGFVVIITERDSHVGGASGSGGSTAISSLGGGESAVENGDAVGTSRPTQHVVQLYDLKNKYTGASIELGSRIRWALSCANSVLLLTYEGQLVSLVEKPWQAKLSLLYRKHLYVTALSLAASRDVGTAGLAEIHRDYAEHLYAKGDFSAAADEYIATIGTLPPSTVISRYLSSQRVRDLTRYLQALVAQGTAVAAPEHTALLLQCVTKLDDTPALQSFVRWAKAGPAQAERHATAAIGVLNACGHGHLAAELSEGQGDTPLLLKLLIEETQQYDKALSLLEVMPLAARRASLLKWGRVLLTSRPAAATELLATLCYGLPAAAMQASAATSAPPPSKSELQPPLGSNPVTATSSEQLASAIAVAVKPASGPLNAAESSPPLETFISLFSAHRRSLIAFLEALLERYITADRPPPVKIADTLLHLYLTPVEPMDATPKAALIAKYPTPAFGSATLAPFAGTTATLAPIACTPLEPLGLLARKERAGALIGRHPAVPLGDDHALLLSFEHRWVDGRAALYARLGRIYELLRHHVAEKDDERVLRTSRHYGEAEPQMWLTALRHFVGMAPGQDERLWTAHLVEVLNAIETEHVLAPLELLKTLSRNDSPMPLLLVTEVFERHLRSADSAMAEQGCEASRFDEDVAKMRIEMAEIDCGARVFQLARCSSCHGPLELPSAHFHCMHTYHIACLGDHDHECPVCAPQHRRVAEHQHQQRALAHGQSGFFHALEATSDELSAVAEFLGRGVLSAGHEPRVE